MKHLHYLFMILMLSGPVSAYAVSSAQEVIMQTATRVVKALNLEKEEIKKNPRLIYDLVDQYILPAFDFTRMSRLVLGKHWRAASNDEKSRFIKEFRLLMVRTYATAMMDYSDKDIVYLPQVYSRNAKKVKVKTEVVQDGGASIPIDYSLYLRNGEWKIYDVIIDNVSLVVNYRSSFSSQIRKTGSVSKLIDKLHARNMEVIDE